MYERFTDRARKVVQLASHEAQRLNHEYVGTEHILLGLIAEGAGVAANVLKILEIDLHQVRREVEKVIASRPDMVTGGNLPQTPGAKRAIQSAMEEAHNLNHNHVGTEHLLLGTLRETEGVAAQVLVNLGLKLEDVRQEVLTLLGATSIEPSTETLTGSFGMKSADQIEYTDRARKVMLLAAEEAYNFGHTYIGPEHILLAIYREGTGIGVEELNNAGLTESRVREEIEKLLRVRGELKGQCFQLSSAAHDTVMLAAPFSMLTDAERVDSDHLLLSLLKSQDSSRDRERIITELLRNLGVSGTKLFGVIRRRLKAEES